MYENLDRALSSRENATPFRVWPQDNPQSIRLRKYATGTPLVLEGRGAEPGRTPRHCVWGEDCVRLYRYESGPGRRFAVPVLLVYAHILRPYILDLVPGRSFVEHLLGGGFDVYLLDWGVPDREDVGLSFENYILDYLPAAAERVLEASHAAELTVLGHCMGGTISAAYAALFPERLRNLILLAAPVDFAPREPGLMGLWTLLSRHSGRFFDPDFLVDTFGNVPEDALQRALEAGISLLPYHAELYARAWDRLVPEDSLEPWLAVSRWVDDGTPFPGAAFRQWVRDFYQGNRLVKGELRLRDRRVELPDVRASLLNTAGRYDVVCPLSQARAATGLVGSRDRKELFLPAGHVGLMASPEAARYFWPRITRWLEPRSQPGGRDV